MMKIVLLAGALLGADAAIVATDSIKFYSGAVVDSVPCPAVRPDEKTCPTVPHPQGTKLPICGYTATRSQKSFDRPCSACKDKTITKYYPVSCLEIITALMPPFVKPEMCGTKICQQWENCLADKCVDKCTTMRCARGCGKGKCL